MGAGGKPTRDVRATTNTESDRGVETRPSALTLLRPVRDAPPLRSSVRVMPQRGRGYVRSASSGWGRSCRGRRPRVVRESAHGPLPSLTTSRRRRSSCRRNNSIRPCEVRSFFAPNQTERTPCWWSRASSAGLVRTERHLGQTLMTGVEDVVAALAPKELAQSQGVFVGEVDRRTPHHQAAISWLAIISNRIAAWTCAGVRL